MLLIKPIFVCLFTDMLIEHVMDRDVFGHGYYERNLSLDSLLNGLCSLVSWNVDGRRIGLRFLLGLQAPDGRSVCKSRRLSWANHPRTTLTEGNTGSPRCSPSTPGLTPPTIFVPHSKDSLTLAVACLPVEQLSYNSELWASKDTYL